MYFSVRSANDANFHKTAVIVQKILLVKNDVFYYYIKCNFLTAF